MKSAPIRVLERGRVRGVLFLGVALVAAGLSLIVSWSTQAQTVNRAGLVVQFGDGSVQTYCIQFTSPSITGYDLLQATGNLQVIYDTASTGMGAGVCKINNDGCNFPLQDCFCQCQGIDCVYWSYFHLETDNTWIYSQLGASSHTLQNGNVDGWRWGTGTLTTATPPPVYTFNQLCSTTGTSTPTPTPSPTTSGTPSVTPTPSPTTSGTPSVTPTRTQTPTPTFTPGVVQIQFAANPTTLTAGQCAIVNWRVTGPWTAIFLDSAIVQPEEQRQVCPSQTQTYTLRAEYAGGAETRTVTLQVTPAGSPTAAATTPFVSPTTPPPATTQVPLPTTPAPTDSPTPTLDTATLTASPTAGLATATVPAEEMTATATSLAATTPAASSTPESRVALEPGAPAEPDAAPSVTETTGEPAEDVPLLLLQYALFIVILGLLGAAGVFLLWRRSRVNDE